MWLLQPKNLHKKHLLWLKIVGFCLSIHLIALFWVFCVYQENKYMHAFSVNKKMDYSAPIIFCSLPTQSLRETVKKENKTISKPITVAAQKTAPAKPIAQNKTTIPPAKAEAKATTIETKKIVQGEKKTTPVETPKPVILQKAEIKKEAPPTLIENKIAKASDSAPSFAKSFGGHSKATSDKLDVTSNIVPATPEIKKELAPAIPQNAQVSNNFREVEALRRGAQLQKELVHKWQPPIGVSPDCACDISFFVTKKGTIEQLKMVKSSGIMMFDISARQALFSMKMPQWTYGKPLIISFKQ